MTSYLVGLRCVSCGAVTSDRTRDPLCPACGGFLQAEYDLDKMRAVRWTGTRWLRSLAACGAGVACCRCATSATW